jgi:hypothetical protein
MPSDFDITNENGNENACRNIGTATACDNYVFIIIHAMWLRIGTGGELL